MNALDWIFGKVIYLLISGAFLFLLYVIAKQRIKEVEENWKKKINNNKPEEESNREDRYFQDYSGKPRHPGG
jgi:hypothetical protein